ncbi:hypothetical protein MANES_04G071450v8 [Manihot esculenta]|uniref:Uncharacterized protein n=1 Tax=Manihot esculenta TaxID=3983 RepID=A0ACB7HVI4_MANES|nr:hypothetical protein MANES_04G071450v8 [Manihot esculenta]
MDPSQRSSRRERTENVISGLNEQLLAESFNTNTGLKKKKEEELDRG